MMSPSSAQEDAKLDAMQRSWQSKRSRSSSLFEDLTSESQLLAMPQASCSPSTKSLFSTIQSKGKEEDAEVYSLQEQVVPEILEQVEQQPSCTVLDASTVGDFPAVYTVCSLERHQMPAVGVFVDKRIVPGFKYRVRPLPQIGQDPTMNKCLFNDSALTLKSIGRGYARRFTFEATDSLNNNENYFWSDNRPEGYAFELEVISEGDKFTIFDMNKEAQGIVEVLQLEGPQFEISNVYSRQNIEKRANVRFTGKVEFYETGVAKPMPLSGLAVAVKYKHKGAAEIVKVQNVVINKQRYTLFPGIQKIHRRVTVRGRDINDVPTQYSMHGLEPYELPVVGTYVDPRVIPGFYYKVRPSDRKEHLFGGRALKLLSIGMGYAKRLTFEPDSLLTPDNYLWSDNHPDGLGLEIRAVHKDMKFIIKARDQILGEASVFRADKPQIEEKMEKIKTQSGKYAIEKYVHIDVMCHIAIAIPGGGCVENTETLMRVYGLAVVRKEPNRNEAHVIRVENVGLDSQLNVLFAQTHTELTFYPKK
ncbi:uncharacterized protein LOC123014691 [Tribolium madens]|uniref:uncharacterized protein LOC123014691 n=1 Tax=Tribolium madens TaxID=41895 RepID=UPI001CF75002|nr:uncharacterized protein LOC123014691 [Tribolium madens]